MRSSLFPLLTFLLLLSGCPQQATNSESPCPGPECPENEEIISAPAGLYALENAPEGIPKAWISVDGTWRVVILTSNGLYEGRGANGSQLSWSNLIEWTTQVVSAPKSFDAMEGLDGSIHAIFEKDGDLWYYNSLTFGASNTIIETEVGNNPRPALIIDSNDTVHVSYFSESKGALRYAMLTASAWDAETIPLPTSPCPSDDCGPDLAYGAYSDIGLQGGAISVTFYDQGRGNLCFSTRLAETWVGQVLDGEDRLTGVDSGDVGLWPSMTFDEKGNISVSYFGKTSGDLRFAFLSGGELKPIQVDDGLIYDFGDQPIENAEKIDPSVSDTEVITNTSTGAFSQLLSNPAGQPIIFYLDAHIPGILRAERRGNQWTLTQLPISRPGGFHISGSSGPSEERLVVFQTWELEDDGRTARKGLMAWYEPAQ